MSACKRELTQIAQSAPKRCKQLDGSWIPTVYDLRPVDPEPENSKPESLVNGNSTAEEQVGLEDFRLLKDRESPVIEEASVDAVPTEDERRNSAESLESSDGSQGQENMDHSDEDSSESDPTDAPSTTSEPEPTALLEVPDAADLHKDSPPEDAPLKDSSVEGPPLEDAPLIDDGEETSSDSDMGRMTYEELKVDEARETGVDRFKETKDKKWWCNLIGCFHKFSDWKAWERHVCTHDVQIDGPLWETGSLDLDDDRYHFPKWTYIGGVYQCPRGDCEFADWRLPKVLDHLKAHTVDFPPKYTHEFFQNALRGIQRAYDKEGWATSELPAANSYQTIQINWCNVCKKQLDFAHDDDEDGSDFRKTKNPKAKIICDECYAGFHIDCLRSEIARGAELAVDGDDWLCAACSRNRIRCAGCNHDVPARKDRHRCASYRCTSHYCLKCVETMADVWIFPTPKDRKAVKSKRKTVRRPFLCALHYCQSCAFEIAKEKDCSYLEALDEVALADPDNMVVCSHCKDLRCWKHSKRFQQSSGVKVAMCLSCHFQTNKRTLNSSVTFSNVNLAAMNDDVECDCRDRCVQSCTNAMTRIQCNEKNCNVLRMASRDLGIGTPLKDCGNRPFLASNVRAAKANLKKLEIEGKGLGIAVKEGVGKRQLVCDYVGEIIDAAEFEARKEFYSQMEMGTIEHEKQEHYHWYIMELAPNVFIDSTVMGNISKYFNHSCEPNCVCERWNVDGTWR